MSRCHDIETNHALWDYHFGKHLQETTTVRNRWLDFPHNFGSEYAHTWPGLSRGYFFCFLWVEVMHERRYLLNQPIQGLERNGLTLPNCLARMLSGPCGTHRLPGATCRVSAFRIKRSTHHPHLQQCSILSASSDMHSVVRLRQTQSSYPVSQ